MSDQHGTSLSLLERITDQDQEAWARVVALYGPLVQQWCRRWGIGPEDISDVVQEVFLAVWRALGDFQRQREGSFRTWMRGIARHKLLDHWRRRQRQPVATGGTDAHVRLQELAESGLEPTEDEAEISGLYRRGLEQVRAQFEVKSWQAFWRVAVDGRPTDVVAAELGMSPVAVRIAKSRVLARLREEMQALIE